MNQSVNYFYLLLSLIGGIVLLLSCGGEGKNSSLNENLMIEMVNYNNRSAGCDSGSIDNCAEIKIEFPRITIDENQVVEEKINNSITRLFNQGVFDSTAGVDFEMMMDGFIRDHESFKQEFPDASQSWTIEKTGNVQLNKANIFSMDYTEYSFTGGAHPNTLVLFKNYNLVNGEEIKLNELIETEKIKELNQIAEAEFRKLKNLNTSDDLGKAGFWFGNNKFKLNDNFLITDSSLVFYYNNYEITAYAFGPTELMIPYSKIKSLIDEKSLLKNLIK